MNETLEQLRDRLTPHLGTDRELAALERELGDRVDAFRTAETALIVRYGCEGYPLMWPAVLRAGIGTGEFHVLMGLTLPQLRLALETAAPLPEAGELVARGTALILAWERAQDRLATLAAMDEDEDADPWRPAA